MTSNDKVILFKEYSEDYAKVFSENNFDAVFVQPLTFKFLNLDILLNKLHDCVAYGGLILTSPRAVEAVAKSFAVAKDWKDTEELVSKWSGLPTYTVGSKSARLIKQALKLDSLGETTGSASNLAEYIAKYHKDTSNQKLLFPCGNLRSETLPNKLKEAGIDVDCITVYETYQNERLKNELMELVENVGESKAGVFFSPSGVSFVLDALESNFNVGFLRGMLLIAIGNTTSEKMRSMDLVVSSVSPKPTAECLVQCLIDVLPPQLL